MEHQPDPGVPGRTARLGWGGEGWPPTRTEVLAEQWLMLPNAAKRSSRARFCRRARPACGLPGRTAASATTKRQRCAGFALAHSAISDLNIVGRYALNFRWSDGHETGIYSFQYLRDICEQ